MMPSIWKPISILTLFCCVQRHFIQLQKEHMEAGAFRSVHVSKNEFSCSITLSNIMIAVEVITLQSSRHLNSRQHRRLSLYHFVKAWVIVKQSLRERDNESPAWCWPSLAVLLTQRCFKDQRLINETISGVFVMADVFILRSCHKTVILH